MTYLVTGLTRRHGPTTVHTNTLDAAHAVIGRESGYAGRWSGAAGALGDMYLALRPGEGIRYEACVLLRSA